ncbi:zinc ribbon domain-containing protein [Streptomyces nojiriensis]|uniref:zinc ribbon domain-containing protein n=1 Tax=Streptomyces nojiriensis TaxID=66374 RepID=UPI003647BCB3
MTAELLAAHWNATDVAALASGQDAGGRKLPSNAWMALRRLGWAAAPPVGIRVNDRMVRMAQEQAGRSLRSAKWRSDLTSAVITTWPADPAKRTSQEWDAVRAAVPGGEHLPSSVISSRTRQICTFVRKHDRLPTDVFSLEYAPKAARMLLLAACDGQQASIERADEPHRALLRLQLPTRPDPRSYEDWTWVSCPIPLPPTIPAAAVLHLPTLRLHRGRVRVDLAYTHPVPRTARTGHTVALGVDWGLNTLLSAGAARLHEDGRIAALGAGGMFRAAGVLAKQHRLRRAEERLRAKADHYQRLIGGRTILASRLEAKQGVLSDEISAVATRRSNLNTALAWAAARWAVDQAVAAGASVIYIEDLRSLEARHMGRTVNTRMSQQIRGQIVDRMRHLGAEVGIAVVTVPARNTSRHCPRCLTPLRHRKAPDRPTTPGWKWAVCPGCGWQGDRDHGAWQRIASRGFVHQTRTTTDRTTGIMAIRAIVDTLEARAVIAKTPLKPVGEIDPKPDRPGGRQNAPRPGDAGHPPPPGSRAWRASVRRDTFTRTGPDCPVQPTGSRA